MADAGLLARRLRAAEEHLAGEQRWCLIPLIRARCHQEQQQGLLGAEGAQRLPLEEVEESTDEELGWAAGPRTTKRHSNP